MTREEFESKLTEIGWSAKGEIPNRFIFDHEGNNTYMRIWEARFEQCHSKENFNLQVYFDSIEVVNTDKNCLTVRSKFDPEITATGFFLQFYSYKP